MPCWLAVLIAFVVGYAWKCIFDGMSRRVG